MHGKLNRHLLPLTLLATAVSLSGCGMTPGGTQPSGIDLDATGGPRIFAAGGAPQIVVKTKPGMVMGSHPSVAVVRAIPALRAQVIAVPNGDVDSVLQRLRNDPAVQYAEPNYVVRAFDLPAVAEPNDPLYAKQYGPQMVRAPEAWTKSRGAGVVVAVVDTGTDVTHPDLAAQVVAGFAVADASPTLQPPEKDDNGHGTHVAGSVAAAVNNGVGVAGVAADAQIMPVKVLSAEGSGSDAGVAEGIVWAADNGANVISMSLGGPGASQVMEDAVKHALDKGIIVVAAMGNDGNGQKSYPAAIPGVIAVGAVDKNGKVASFSQYGSWISVAAPGVQVLSTFPTYPVDLTRSGFPQNYAVLDGTSMATPHVSGVVALMRAAYPDLTPADLKKKLEQTAQRKNGKFDTKYGWGVADAFAAVG